MKMNMAEVRWLYEITPEDKQIIEIARKLKVSLSITSDKGIYRLAKLVGKRVLTTKRSAVLTAQTIRWQGHCLARVKEMKQIPGAERYAVYFHGEWMR